MWLVWMGEKMSFEPTYEACTHGYAESVCAFWRTGDGWHTIGRCLLEERPELGEPPDWCPMITGGKNMKQDLSFLTEAHIEGIEKWLDEKMICPFADLPSHFKCKDLCLKIFPGLEFNFWEEPECPCAVYAHEYVREVAHNIVTSWRKEHGKS